MSEINVTPMVDVMLVLLIIFMVSAPLLTVGVPIDLPQSQAKSLDQDKEPLTISVNDKGQVFLQNTEINDRRPGAQAAGDRRGARRHRGAHLCARRQEGRLRHDDEGDGPAVGGRLPRVALGDGIRAGLEEVMRDEDGIGDFGRRCTRRCCCGRWCRFPARPFEATPAESLPVDIVSEKDFSQMTKGVKDAPKPVEKPKPLVEKIDEPKPVEDSKPKVTEKQEIKPTAAEARRSRSRSPSPIRSPRRSRSSDEAEAARPRPKPLPPKKPPQKQQPKFDADKIAALLDKRDPQRNAATGERAQFGADARRRHRQRRAAVAERRSTRCARG